MKPLISIGMSVFNCEATIARTIRSVLNQTYGNWEFLIFDDGSNDGSLDVIRQFTDKRIKIFSDKKNTGLSNRLNQAIGTSSGEFFARIDGDDIAYPDRFEKQLFFLTENPDVDLVGSRVILFDDNGKPTGCYPYRGTHEDICERFRAGFYLPHPTWMGKIDWFKKNQYRVDMKKTQDQELLLRTFRYSRFACLSEILIGYRMPRLSLKTILTGRYYFSKALLRNEAGKGKALINPLIYICQQIIKGGIDVFAVTTGLDYKILRHRAIQPAPEEFDKWLSVWDSCCNDRE